MNDTPVTLATLQKIMPHARGLERFVDPLNAAMAEFHIDTPARQAAFIAQLAHESGQFRFMEELASGEAYDDRADLGNTDPDAIAIAAKHGTTPGRWWKGHGPIQITGYFNHMAAGFHLGLDLRNEPELLCDPVHGCRAAALFWRDHACNDLADRGDFIAITRRINGGINGLSDRVAFHARARACLLSPPP